MSDRYLLNAKPEERVQFIDDDGNPVLTADGKSTVQRSFDNFYNNPNLLPATPWQAAPFQLPMTKVGDVNSPGWWKSIFDSDGFAADHYTVVSFDISGNSRVGTFQSLYTIGDPFSQAVNHAASSAVGDTDYDDGTSEMTQKDWQDNNVTDSVHDVKDISGDPAQDRSWNTKIRKS